MLDNRGGGWRPQLYKEGGMSEAPKFLEQWDNADKLAALVALPEGIRVHDSILVQREAKMTTQFKIEKDVMMPTRSRESKYPWGQMSAGDSFFVAADKDGLRGVQRKLYMNGKAWIKKNKPDLKVATRVEAAGVRVWLVSK